MSAVILVDALWATLASAQLQAGSLEFVYTAPLIPLGVVAFNYTSDGKPPFITYELPITPGGQFTAPWLMLSDEEGEIVGDTVILLTNPDSVSRLTVNVMLRDLDGMLAEGCIQELILEPKATVKRSTRVLFRGCPLIP